MPLPDLSGFKYEPSAGAKSEAGIPKAAVKRRRIVTPKEESLAVAKRPQNWPGPLPPLLEPDLKVVFVGFNPGIDSGKTGHHYAHHSNRFYKFLFWSGITPTMHAPADDVRMPALYRIGFTDLVARCTKGIQQLNKEEMREGAMSLNARIAEVAPQAVCLVGKGIWEAIAGANNWDKKQFRYGRDLNHRFGDDKSALYCVSSTSGLNSIAMDKQLEGWSELVEDLKLKAS